MIGLISAVTGVLLLFISQASAGDDPSCINITLPNVLGIGECLGTDGDICSSESKGIVVTVIKLVQCSLEGIAELNLDTQLHLTAELIGFILERNDLGDLADVIRGLCSSVQGPLNKALKSLGLGLLSSTIKNLFKCKDLKVTGLICEDDIVLNIPSALNAGQCFGDTLVTCDGNTPVDINVLEGLFNSQLCVLQSLSSQDLNDVVSGLTCSILSGIKTGLGDVGVIVSPLIDIVGRLFGTAC
ncbi:hypothetical protein ISCGN_021251 [Ixodes scapularis]